MSERLLELEPESKSVALWAMRNLFARSSGSGHYSLAQATRYPAQARPYQHGDPIQAVDWRAYARTDQLIVRTDLPETSLQICLHLDISHSMHFPRADLKLSGDFSPCTKAEYATRLLFQIAYQHGKAQDHVRLFLWDVDQYKGPLVQQLIFRNSQELLDHYHALRAFCSAKAKPATSNLIYANMSQIAFHDIPLFLMEHEFRFGDARIIATDAIHMGTQVLTKFYDSPIRGMNILMHTLHSLEIDTRWLKSDSFYDEQRAQGKMFKGRQLLKKDMLAQERERWCAQLKTLASGRENSFYLQLRESSLINEWEHFLEGCYS